MCERARQAMARLRIYKYCVFSFDVGGISTELSSVGSSLESVIDIELIIINSVRHGRHSLSITYTFTCKFRRELKGSPARIKYRATIGSQAKIHLSCW